MKLTKESKIGLWAIALLIAIALAVSFLHPASFVSKQYTIYATFSDARGLRSGAKVFFAGVRVGDVKAVDIDGDHAKVTLAIDDGTNIPKDASFSIAKQGLVGALYVGIDGGHSDAGFLSPGDTAQEASGTDMMPLINKAGKLLKTMDAIEDNVKEFRK